MAKKVKLTTTIDAQTKDALDKMSEALGKPTNQLLDYIVENFYLRSWPRKYRTYLGKRRAELERIMKLDQETP